MSTWLYPYKNGSKSISALRRKLNAKTIKTTNSKFRPTRRKTIINWGSSQLPEQYLTQCKVLNHPEQVDICSNKLNFFRKYEDTNYLVPHTTNKNTAFNWVQDGKTICCRTKLTGHSGEGIVLYTPDDILNNEISLPSAPLYTQYIKKKHEFRIHIVNNQIIDTQRKSLRTDADRPEKPDFRIRTHNNGFVFVRNDTSLKDKKMMSIVNDITLALHQETSLSFGAYDVIYNDKQQKAYILEINTAPGLTGTTLDNYVNAFKTMGL